MRVGKSIALAIVLVLGLVLQCELFQQELSYFDTGAYRSIDVHYETEQERESLLSDLMEQAKKNDVHLFTTSYTYNNDIETVLTIYGDSYVRNTIKKRQGISNRLYRSLTSGMTQVKYRDFQDLLETSQVQVYSVSFVGTREDVYAVYKELWESYSISAPGISGPNDIDLTWIIWGTIDIVMLLIGILCVAIKKKEVTIQISMGQSPWSLIFKNIIEEFLVDVLLFIGVKALCSLFIDGIYMVWMVFGIYLAGVFISCLLYCSFAFYDIRRAFSNMFVPTGLKNTIYVLKFVVSVGTVFTIITNITLVEQNRMSLGDTSFVETYEDYSYLELADQNTSFDEDMETRWEEQCALWDRIYAENYTKLQPAVNELALVDQDRGENYILVNEYGVSALESFVQGLEYDGDADVVYFIPEKYDTDETRENAKLCLGNIITDTSGLKEDIVIYQDQRSYSYINRNLENNMTTVWNPVVIYAKYHGADYVDRLHIENAKNVMFRLTDEDLVALTDKYKLETEGYELQATKVIDRFQYYNNVLKQGISFCSSVAIFILILHVILILTIVLMEYKNNAMEFSLQKILGYSFFKRSESILCFSVLSNVIVTFAAVMIGILTEKYTIMAAVGVGLMVMVIELVIEIFNILRMEKENLLKTLKGGCL